MGDPMSKAADVSFEKIADTSGAPPRFGMASLAG